MPEKWVVKNLKANWYILRPFSFFGEKELDNWGCEILKAMHLKIGAEGIIFKIGAEGIIFKTISKFSSFYA